MIVCVSAITCQYTGSRLFHVPNYLNFRRDERWPVGGSAESRLELRSAYRAPGGGLGGALVITCSPVCGSTRTATGWTETSPLARWEFGVCVGVRSSVGRDPADRGGGGGWGATNATLLVCPALGNPLADVTVRCRSGVFYFLVFAWGTGHQHVCSHSLFSHACLTTGRKVLRVMGARSGE